ncbi:MAG TPA: MarR family transcriptional regulator [Thermoprotei archaeon]|nr:MarR family transcriptional regulator [Thermoprotei archaeon]
MRDIDKDPTYTLILSIIHRLGKAYPDKIASKLGVSRQAIDYRLKKLVDAGYIEKHYNRRVYYILTDLGIDIVTRLSTEYTSIDENTRKADLLKYIPILGISLGIITLGQYIALGDAIRGVIGLISWTIIGIVAYYYLKKRISR